MFNSVWTTLKRFGIDLYFHQSLYNILRPPCPRLSHKNVCSFILRSCRRTPNQFDLLRQILCLAFLNWTVLLLTFTLSFISELSRGFAAILHVCYKVNGSFCLFWLVFFFNVIFPLSLCSLSFYIICMHACVFFFFFWERLVIHPSIHSLFLLSTLISI